MRNTKKLKFYAINFLFLFVIFSIDHLPCIGCEGLQEEQISFLSTNNQDDQPLNSQLNSSFLESSSLNDSPTNFRKTSVSASRTNSLVDFNPCSADIKGDLSTTVTINESYCNDSPTVSASREHIYSFEEDSILEIMLIQKSKRRVDDKKITLKTHKNYSKAKKINNSSSLLGKPNNKGHTREAHNIDVCKTFVVTNKNAGYVEGRKY